MKYVKEDLKKIGMFFLVLILTISAVSILADVLYMITPDTELDRYTREVLLVSGFIYTFIYTIRYYVKRKGE